MMLKVDYRVPIQYRASVRELPLDPGWLFENVAVERFCTHCSAALLSRIACWRHTSHAQPAPPVQAPSEAHAALQKRPTLSSSSERHLAVLRSGSRAGRNRERINQAAGTSRH